MWLVRYNIKPHCVCRIVLRLGVILACIRFVRGINIVASMPHAFLGLTQNEFRITLFSFFSSCA
jgi:hypothetical protein